MPTPPIQLRDAPVGNRPPVFYWVVADAAALAALTPSSADIGKVAFQQDDGSVHILLDDSPPTWFDAVSVAVMNAAIDAAITNLIGTAPAALDTLGELSDALADDASFAASVATSLAGKQAASNELSGLALLAATGLVRRTGSGTYGVINPDGSTVELSGSNLQIKAGGVGATQLADSGVTLAKLANLATQTFIGRNTGGTGVPEAVTISQVLDWISSTRGTILYRGATGWAALPPGTAGQFLKSNGENADLSYATASAGDSTRKAAFASAPANANDGDLFFPTDGFVIQRDTGSVYNNWGPIYPLTPPVLSSFAWVNQGSATATEAKGGIYLLAPANASENWRILKKSAPATPYTATACLLPALMSVDYAQAGLVFRQSSDGKLACLELVSISGFFNFQFSKMNSATSFNSTYGNTKCSLVSPLWLQIADDGTNRKCSFSADGQDFIPLHSIGRTDFLTADEVGFFVSSFQGTYDVGATFLHFVIS